MGAMLSEGWCHEREDKTSVVVCPFHALEFDGDGCTILPGAKKKTLPQLEPLELIIQGNFIWFYGGCEPKMPIPNILNELASQYEFIGHTADTSVETDLLTMLLNMHRPLGQKFLNFAKVVVEQNADILHKIYPNTPQKIKLNNEVGMDWVRRNSENWPEIAEPNFSKTIFCETSGIEQPKL